MPDLNRSLLSEGENADTLGGLTDVTITTPEEFQNLVYNGTEWVNGYSPTVSYVRNAEANTLTTGTVVYLFGGTGDHATVKRADNDSDTTSSKTVGVVAASIAASENGPVVTRGYVDGIDLSAGYTPGDVLWLGDDGNFTTTKPTAPEHLVFIGVVVRATENGIIYVATQNGYELDELHDVALANVASGDFLKYNGSLWINDAINLGTDTVGNYVSDVSSGALITVNHTPAEGSTATVNLSNGSSGQIIVANSSGVPAYVTMSGDATIDANGAITIAANAVVLGTDTTGNYVATITGTTNEISVSGSGSESAAVTIGLPANVTIANNLTVTGNLTVSGTTTTVNTATLNIADNLITLNSDFTSGAPTENAGVEVLRGSSSTVAVRWNETNDKWEITNDGTTYGNVVSTADSGTVTSAMIADGTIVNADVSTTAAIDLSKLASGSSAQIIIANGTGVPTYVSLSGDATITNTGNLQIASNSIVNADINTSAAIALTKLASDTTTALGVGTIEIGHASDTTLSRAAAGRLAVEGANVVTVSSTDTLSNKTLDGAVLTGTLTANGGTGTNGQYLQSTATGVKWADSSGGDPLNSNVAAIFIMDIGV